VTITAYRARAAGRPHDFFSEGDYWWPIRRIRRSYIVETASRTPDNFVDHRRALVRLSVEVPALTAAWKTDVGRSLRRACAAPPAGLVR